MCCLCENEEQVGTLISKEIKMGDVADDVVAIVDLTTVDGEARMELYVGWNKSIFESIEINYCPKCGRKLRDGVKDET